MKTNKIQKVRMRGRLNTLIKELKSKKSIRDIDKDTIIIWVNLGYECGLKDAGDIIGENLGKAINKELKKK